MRAKELQAPGGVGGDELFQKQPAEQPREHAHRQEEARPAGDPALAVQGNAAARNDHVDVRMVGERRSPCVQHGSHADPRAQMFGIGGDRDHRLGGGLEQKVVNHGLVLIGDVADRRRQGEDHMVIGDRQQLGLAFGQPSPRGRALALRAMPIAAAIVGDDFVGAVLAARDMPAESRRAAAFDRRHHLQLPEAHMAGVGLAPRRSVVAEDIRDFQNRTPHDRQGLCGRLGASGLQRGQAIQRAHDVPDGVGGDARVKRGRVELGVPQQSRAIVRILLCY